MSGRSSGVLKFVPKRLRFTPDDDLVLLRECISQNPIDNVEQWETVQNNVELITGKKFAIRTLKDHLFLILEIWIEKDKSSQIRSGVEEIYSERDVLLQEIKDLCENAKINPYKKRKIVSKEKQIAELGRKAREVFADQFCEGINIEQSDHDYVRCSSPLTEVIIHTEQSEHVFAEEPIIIDMQKSQCDTGTKTQSEFAESAAGKKSLPKKRVVGPGSTKNNKSSLLRRSALDYLQNKEEKDRKIKEKELELEDRKIKLEERKMKIEEERHEKEMLEKDDRLTMDKERFKQEFFERHQQGKIIEYQQELVSTLLERLRKHEKCSQ